MGRAEKDGSFVYELDVKGKATAGKLRARTDSTKREGGFVSFDAFDSGPPTGDEKMKAGAQLDAEVKRPLQPVTKHVDWDNPPTELLALEAFDSGEDQAAYLEHFVRFMLGAWRRQRATGFVGFSDIGLARFQDSLAQTEEDLAPLILLLRSGETLEKGESKADRKGQRTARTSQDGCSHAEASVLGQLTHMAACAEKRLYAEAHTAYMKLTLGNKTWHNTCVVHISANQMQGAREYRRNRDDLNTYDVDPVAQKYMHAVRKLVQLSQCLRPNEDQSKNVPL